VTLAMTPDEREAFLAGVHVGVLAVEEAGRGPLTVPVWYAYEPGGTVNVITDGESLKARRLRDAGRCSLCAQSEEPPYRYVSVEGPVTEDEHTVDPDERRAMAHRYLGAEIGARPTSPNSSGNCPRPSRRGTGGGSSGWW